MHMHSLKLLRPTVWEELHLQENSLFDLDLGVKVMQNGVQYALHHATKFEVARSMGLGDAFTRKYII